jgi:Na+/H+ antiporter NhaD/arsenite permease-like protein
MLRFLMIFAAVLFPPAVPAAVAEGSGGSLNLTADGYGLAALALFLIAYALVIAEEFLQLRKSKPVMTAAGLIWALVGIAYALRGHTEHAEQVLGQNLLEYGELLLFLLVAMTYINTLQEREVFSALRAWLVSAGFSLRSLFWLTGLLAFFISPFADNLTTALIMGAVVTAVGTGNPRFVAVSCISIVVAANAGGAYSPFGDITTLMVWQRGDVHFWDFFHLFVPSLVNWFVPALLMSFAVPRDKPAPMKETVAIKHGGLVVTALFLLTIVMAVAFHNFLDFPPVLGMMTGLGLLSLYSHHLQRLERRVLGISKAMPLEASEEFLEQDQPRTRAFDVFISMKEAEWDTLMFFYGVILCVGGLGALGYLTVVSAHLYTGLGPTWANVLVGLLSAVVDNIPVMYAVLTMHPDMSLGQWLLVTLTTGVGGSLLSIGSAAGVALMGQARGLYTFFSHLKWSWAVALGYAASIWVHLTLNGHLHHVAIGG